ncbi:hypothetical protein [Candidatus Magnetaquicoccus inordinatus]|uniref:hypothetical protein n=1 Tax=Candidatus Magnetaquicoccus inordinatus TaxID=2496818 RepID=UPI00102D204C|nr:hypothetical protein [Candidatus Magnetaquicoccus inordinatus]
MGGAVEDVITGIDDLFAGWEEYVTGRRKEALEKAHSAMRRSHDELAAVQQVVLQFADIMQTISNLEAENQQELKKVFHFEHNLPDIHLTSDLKKVKNVLSVIKKMISIGNKVITVSAFAVRLSMLSTAAIRGASGIRGIIHAAIVEYQMAMHIASTAHNSLRPSLYLSLSSITNTLSKISMAITLVVSVMQSILNAIEVAQIRNLQQKIKDERENIKQAIEELKGHAQLLIESVSYLCVPLHEQTEPLPIIHDPTASEKQVDLQLLKEDVLDMFQNLLRTEEAVQTQEAERRARIVRALVDLRDILIRSSYEQISLLRRFQTALLQAARALQKGSDQQTVMEIFELDATLVAQLATHVKEHPGQVAHTPVLQLSATGLTKLLHVSV